MIDVETIAYRDPAAKAMACFYGFSGWHWCGTSHAFSATHP
jgi:hypothetical protein